MADRSVAMWEALGVPGARNASEVMILKPEHRKSAVFRLMGAGPTGGDVVAKRASRTTLTVEYRIFREVLAASQVPGLECYGLLDDDDLELGWLFLEDGGDVRLDLGRDDHRRAVGRWLGNMHVATAKLNKTVPLPDRGPTCYRQVVRSAYDVLARNRSNPALQREHVATLDQMVSHLDQIEQSWESIEHLCTLLPRTLVHGGFGRKNVRIGPDGQGVFVFDWEFGGWGTPVADLGRVDLEAYANAIADHWAPLDTATLEQLAAIGKALWCSYVLPPDEVNLASRWPERAMHKISSYEAAMAAICRFLEMKTGSALTIHQ